MLSGDQRPLTFDLKDSIKDTFLSIDHIPDRCRRGKKVFYAIW
jgi:hypothetical protein